jgi:hypothetical protein
MNSAICTLFEGHYHYGVAALINSLYTRGFRGVIYAGYRGELPDWCSSAINNDSLIWPGATTLNVAEGLEVHFLPLVIDYHLTNYKPDFVLKLWAGPAKDTQAIAYFDPDIVVKCAWSFFDKWMNYGVALVHEIIANDMPSSHPIRLQWEEVIMREGRRPVRNLTSYINAGFFGLTKDNIEFLQLYSRILIASKKYYKADLESFLPFDRTHLFHGADQDALNIAAMCCECPISEVGPDGMDFTGAGWIMSHAVGSPKPWKKAFLLSAIKGSPPSLADRAYWANVGEPIVSITKSKRNAKQIGILLASLIGRFYRRY